MKKLKLNLLTSLLLSTIVPALLLSGCGGGENDNGTDKAPVVEQAPVSARDGFNVVAPDEPGYVDLSSLIESGTAGAKVTSVYLESKQGTGECGQVFTSADANGDSANVILGQGFNVTIDGAAICEYTYEVESVALAGQTKTRAKAKIMVASSAGGAAVLKPISIAMAINDLTVTDIKAALGVNFPAGYTLSEDFSVLGDGDVTVNASTFSISYTATAEGVSRVVYALEGDIAGVPDIKMGTLDYAVSDSLNNAPTADNFSYGSDVEINTSVDIDVIDAIRDAVDLDELQLIEVKSYTANVASKDPKDLTNTMFTFEAPTAGKHYVSYMVSDHRGGFATGIVEVTTFDVDQVSRWTDIEHGLLLFTAPQTKVEIDASSDDYQGFHGDTGYAPTLQLATFTFAGAQAYCGARGRLPSPDEMAAMYAAKSPKTTWLWPTGKAYVTQDVATPGLISLSNGTVSPLGAELYYVTCVDSGGLILSADKSVVVANGTDTTTVSVTFSRDTGPVVGVVLDISVTGSVIPSETTVTTDADGKASFTVTNIKAESAIIGVDYTNLTSEIVTVNTSVSFIGDIDTARIESLTVIKDGAVPNGVAKNTLSALSLDFYDNPVAGVLVKVSLDSVTAALAEDPTTLTTAVEGTVEFNVTNVTAVIGGEKVVATVDFTSLLAGYSEQTAIVDFKNLIGITVPTIKVRDGEYACRDAFGAQLVGPVQIQKFMNVDNDFDDDAMDILFNGPWRDNIYNGTRIMMVAWRESHFATNGVHYVDIQKDASGYWRYYAIYGGGTRPGIALCGVRD